MSPSSSWFQIKNLQTLTSTYQRQAALSKPDPRERGRRGHRQRAAVDQPRFFGVVEREAESRAAIMSYTDQVVVGRQGHWVS